MSKVYVKEITNCLDCPNVKIVNDADRYDSFCADDEAAICTASKKEPRTNKVGNYISGEPMLTVAARPYEVKKDLSVIPSWCPLKDKD